VKDSNSILHEVRREADRLVFVPSATFGGAMTLLFGAGAALMVYLSTIPLRHAGTASAGWWIGAIFLLVAGYSASLAIRAWRARSTPLAVEFSGRISYGEREVCAAGTVRAVRIAKWRAGEAGDYEVGFEIAGGETVFIPSMYFARFGARVNCRPFAAQLAEALAVPVVESS
jgi:hypothetical protein